MGIKKLFRRIKCELMYRQAVIKADKAAKSSNDVFFVLPTESGKLMIMTKSMYELFRRKKLVPKDAYAKDLFKDSVYHTRCRSVNAKRAKKRKFLKWKGF